MTTFYTHKVGIEMMHSKLVFRLGNGYFAYTTSEAS